MLQRNTIEILFHLGLDEHVCRLVIAGPDLSVVDHTRAAQYHFLSRRIQPPWGNVGQHTAWREGNHQGMCTAVDVHSLPITGPPHAAQVSAEVLWRAAI